MANFLKSLVLALAMMMTAPVITLAGTSIEIIENESQNTAISIQDNTLHVTGANGQMLYIYNV